MTRATVWDRVRRHGTESESNTHWTKNGMEHTVSHGTDGGQNEMDDYVFMFVASFVMQYTHSTRYYLLDWLCLVGFLALCLCCFRSAMCSFVRTYVRTFGVSILFAPTCSKHLASLSSYFSLIRFACVCVCTRNDVYMKFFTYVRILLLFVVVHRSPCVPFSLTHARGSTGICHHVYSVVHTRRYHSEQFIFSHSG